MKLEKSTKLANPFVPLERIFAKMERISVTLSALLVIATIGYISFHALA